MPKPGQAATNKVFRLAFSWWAFHALRQPYKLNQLLLDFCGQNLPVRSVRFPAAAWWRIPGGGLSPDGVISALQGQMQQISGDQTCKKIRISITPHLEHVMNIIGLVPFGEICIRIYLKHAIITCAGRLTPGGVLIGIRLLDMGTGCTRKVKRFDSRRDIEWELI